MPIAVRIVGGTVMFASSGLFGCVAVPLVRKTYSRITRGVTTRGVITGSQARGDYRAGGTSNCPEVEFETSTGQKITFVSSIGSNAPVRLGRKVKVSYFPDNPQDADITSLIRTWFLPLFVIACMLGFLFGAFMFYTAMFGDAR